VSVGSRDPTSVDHAALNEALQQAAARFGRLSDADVRALRHRRRRTAATMAATLSVAAVATGLGWQRQQVAPAEDPHWTRTLATRAGQHGTLTLADGSTIRLNGATRVEVDFGTTRRSARLVAGEAFFDVRHDPARPFTIRAGGGTARVLGTAFDLDMTRRRVALSVYRGAVGFDATAAASRGVVVRAGYRSTLSRGTVTAPVRFDPTLPDWRQGWIDTSGMRLDDLAQVLSRQAGVRIVPPEGALASMRVVGRFRTDQPRALLSAIGAGYGFEVVERSGALELRARR
jgi:transmembrane sensor